MYVQPLQQRPHWFENSENRRAGVQFRVAEGKSTTLTVHPSIEDSSEAFIIPANTKETKTCVEPLNTEMKNSFLVSA